MKIKSLRSGTLSFREKHLGFSRKEVGTQSLWSGFSMEFFLAWIYPETIMVIGRRSINAFLKYIRIQVSDLSKGISDPMVDIQAF